VWDPQLDQAAAAALDLFHHLLDKAVVQLDIQAERYLRRCWPKAESGKQ
jgi:hypothetical protein